MTSYNRLNCSICLGWFDNSSRITSSFCCHVFHESCITSWTLRQDKNCPCCCQPLGKLRDLFFSSAEFEHNASQLELERCYKEIDRLQEKVSKLKEALTEDHLCEEEYISRSPYLSDEEVIPLNPNSDVSIAELLEWVYTEDLLLI